VKVRIRHPILTKQVEQMQEKWLVIDDIQWRNCNVLYILLWSNIYLTVYKIMFTAY
jgi:hypothetical protein